MITIKECPSFKGVIFASNKGDLYRKVNDELIPLKQRLDKDGYLIVSFRLNGVPYTKKAHRLVAEAFIPNPKNLPFVNHRNGRKNRNYRLNLQWCTAKENRIHAHEHDLTKHYRITVVNNNSLTVSVFNSYSEVMKFINCKNESMVKYLCDCVRTTKGRYKHLTFIREVI